MKNKMKYYLPECKGCENWDNFYGCIDPCELLNERDYEKEIDERREDAGLQND